MYKHFILHPLKKSVFLLGFAVLLLAFGGCSSKTQGDTKSPSDKMKDSIHSEAKDRYRCPMKCTEELYDKPGKCKVCNMDLEKVSPS